MGASLGDFQGTTRFRVERCLGAGAHGVVYRVWDGERSAPVALKTLRELDPGAISRLKREFRALADVAHPNLVALHELVSEGGRWFFTMDLVEGVDFLSWVRPGFNPCAAGRTEPTLPAPRLEASGAGRCEGALDETRLRPALRQLAQAVNALHEAGRLHRDIKPSNVLVTREGRVVLLDFGLVTDLEKPPGQTSEEVLSGTAGYMAPEQAAMSPCDEAADWYAVGVIIYEALTGRLPFSGSQLQVLMDKQKLEPAPPAKVAAGVPADLSRLCSDLLRLRREDRPTGPEVLQQLGGVAPPEFRGAELRATLGVVPLVGRKEQLRMLAESMAIVRQGKPAAVFVHGPVGAGTTSLVRHFAESAQRQWNAVVLAGQCYERESVPYKALDSLVDALARYLSRLPPLEVEALLPRDVYALSRMFPVLRRVVAIATTPARRSGQTPDVHELRRRATNAMRDLLGRIADRRPLVLIIDGLQWGDQDSAALLADLSRAPDPPPLLLVAAHRSDDAERSAPLQMLRASLPEALDVEVTLLSFEEASQLASNLLERVGLPAMHAATIARESAGNPSFVLEMVRYLQVVPHAAPPAIALEEVIRGRLDQLPAAARRLLETVSVAGQPVLVSVASRAADVEADDLATLALLRSAHLLRTVAEGERVESYHDHIRQTVIAGLSPSALAERHLRLAQAMEAADGDPEPIALHYRAANRPDRAAEHAAIAAARASETLAFDRAARLYRLALDLRPGDGRWAGQLEWKLGDALANVGRGADAAAAFLRAADAPGMEAAQGLELRRRAAEQYLRSGHVDEGLEVLRGVLATVGVRFAVTPRQALASLFCRRIQVRLRGLRYKLRDRSQVSPEQLSLLDVYWAGALGLGMIDVMRASAFQARHLLLALRAGEPTRIALALAAEGAFQATSGGRASRRAARLVVAGSRLADRIEDPHAQGFAALTEAVLAFLAGRWRRAYELSEHAKGIFRDRCTGVAWEVSSSQLFSLWSLFYLGDLGELSRRVGPSVREARERGDLYAAASFRTGLTNVALLVRDDVKGARREVREVLAQWSHRGFHFEHYWALLAQGVIDLYDGAGRDAYQRITAQWKDVEGALLLRIQQVRVEVKHLRARSALAALGQGLDDAALIEAARRDADALEREDVAWAGVVAGLLRASIALREGNRPEAARLLEEAASGFDALEMSLFAAAARRRLGALVGGDRGSELVREANERMARQGIVNPDRMTALLAP